MATTRKSKKRAGARATKRGPKSPRPLKSKTNRTATKKPAPRAVNGRPSRAAASAKLVRPKRSASGSKHKAARKENATAGLSQKRDKVVEAPVRKVPAPAPRPRPSERSRQPAPVAVPLLRPREEPEAEGASRYGFAVGDYVVYPSHGVGRIARLESHTVGEQALQMFVISFEKERMTLRVPVTKASTSGMRRLSSPEKMDAAVSALRGRARARRVMWSRRAQEYEAKLNSGDPVSIAQVVRDLHRNVGQPDQSYSERQMYEAALERLAREFAAIQKIEPSQAAERLEKVLRAA
jgi:CarD family transcriptional regulator